MDKVFKGRARGQKEDFSVAWEDSCYPKKEGGLGVRKCRVWNYASNGKHMVVDL